jgi:hypothetical protein
MPSYNPCLIRRHVRLAVQFEFSGNRPADTQSNSLSAYLTATGYLSEDDVPHRNPTLGRFEFEPNRRTFES